MGGGGGNLDTAADAVTQRGAQGRAAEAGRMQMQATSWRDGASRQNMRLGAGARDLGMWNIKIMLEKK